MLGRRSRQSELNMQVSPSGLDLKEDFNPKRSPVRHHYSDQEFRFLTKALC